MKAVERKWGDDGSWRSYGPNLSEARTWECWREDFNTTWYYPLSIRYDNGQLCTFRRKTKGQNNER